MEPMDVLGALYSKRGLRFGGFRTHSFLEATEDLEAADPGIRERIIAEAHHQVCWFWRLPEIVFVFLLMLTYSPVLSLMGFIAGSVYVIFSFYLFGGSKLVTHLSRLWGWVSLPLMLSLAYWVWEKSPAASVSLLVFAVAQGYFKLAYVAFSVAVRAPIFTLLIKTKWGQQQFDRNPEFYSPEAYVVNSVIGNHRGDF